MSTKATLAYGKNFHFYHEVMDDDHVYLELDTTQFEAGYGRVMVRFRFMSGKPSAILGRRAWTWSIKPTRTY